MENVVELRLLDILPQFLKIDIFGENGLCLAFLSIEVGPTTESNNFLKQIGWYFGKCYYQVNSFTHTSWILIFTC